MIYVLQVRGGGTRLPKFKFWAKFPMGLHVILELQIKKNQNLPESDAQNYFNRNPPGAALHPSSFKWTLFSNNTAIFIRTLLTVAFRGVATGNSDPHPSLNVNFVPVSPV